MQRGENQSGKKISRSEQALYGLYDRTAMAGDAVSEMRV